MSSSVRVAPRHTETDEAASMPTAQSTGSYAAPGRDGSGQQISAQMAHGGPRQQATSASAQGAAIVVAQPRGIMEILYEHRVLVAVIIVAVLILAFVIYYFCTPSPPPSAGSASGAPSSTSSTGPPGAPQIAAGQCPVPQSSAGHSVTQHQQTPQPPTQHQQPPAQHQQPPTQGAPQVSQNVSGQTVAQYGQQAPQASGAVQRQPQLAVQSHSALLNNMNLNDLQSLLEPGGGQAPSAHAQNGAAPTTQETPVPTGPLRPTDEKTSEAMAALFADSLASMEASPAGQEAPEDGQGYNPSASLEGIDA